MKNNAPEGYVGYTNPQIINVLRSRRNSMVKRLRTKILIRDTLIIARAEPDQIHRARRQVTRVTKKLIVAEITLTAVENHTTRNSRGNFALLAPEPDTAAPEPDVV